MGSPQPAYAQLPRKCLAGLAGPTRIVTAAVARPVRPCGSMKPGFPGAGSCRPVSYDS